MYNLKDKVVLVTSAASGIGAGIVRAVLNRDAKHVVILDNDVELGKALAEELKSKYGVKKAKFIKCDVTKELDAAFEETVNSFGYIDVVINSSGIMNKAPYVYEKEIVINVTALITSSLKAYNVMHMQQGGKGGTIINIASTAAFTQGYILPVYCAAKSAEFQFSSSLGMIQNCDRSGVRVITICFGNIGIDLLQLKIGVIDPALEADIAVAFENIPPHKVQAAARGLIAAYEKGANGSTWMVADGKPAKDITDKFRQAYEIMAKVEF